MHFVSEDSLKFLRLWKELHAHYQVLSVSRDDEILKMIDLLDTTRAAWSKANSDCHRLNALNDCFQRENSQVADELRISRDKHRESQAQIASLVSKTQLLENELGQYKRRFCLVKKILREQCANMAADVAVDRLKELPFLREDTLPLLSPRDSQSSNTNTEEIDYDRTGDSFADEVVDDGPSRYSRTYQRNSRQSGTNRSERAPKRRSVSQQPTTRRVEGYITEEEEDISKNNFVTPKPKRSRVQHIAGTESCEPLRFSGRTKKSSIRRSISESNLCDAKTLTLRTQNALVHSTLEMHAPFVTMNTTSWTKGRPISECDHNFEMERFCIRATCAVCCKSLSNACYKGLKCRDCGCYVHILCRDNAPMPCVPYVKTPQKNQKRRRLADLCTNKWPKLPPAIVRCVVALEKKHLNTVGLYRIPGSENSVQSLLRAFQSSIPPNLNKFDPEVICSCIKKILRDLQDPLIPSSSYNEFVNAVEQQAYDKLMMAIDDLPVPNRHTLAFLCQHWQAVAHNSDVNQMPIENLAKCLGPTIFGSSLKFSCFQNNAARNDGTIPFNEGETHRQVNVLIQLLKMDQHYWANILERLPAVDGFGSAHRTLLRSARGGLRELNSDNSILGPISNTPTRGTLIQPVSLSSSRPVIFDSIY